MLHATAFRVVGAKDQPANAEQADGVRAHRTRLQSSPTRSVVRAAGLGIALGASGGGAENQEFRMGGGIVPGHNHVASTGQNGAV